MRKNKEYNNGQIKWDEKLQRFIIEFKPFKPRKPQVDLF